MKVKCTLVQALRLCTGRTAHRGSRGIALFFLDHGTRRGWGVSVTPRPLFTTEKDPVPIVHEAGWAPAPVWTGAENLAPTGIRSPDRPARGHSLYRLRYPAHLVKVVNAKFLPLADYRKLAGRPRHWAMSDKLSRYSEIQAQPLLHTPHALALESLHVVHTPSSCVAFDCRNKYRNFTSAALIDLCL